MNIDNQENQEAFNPPEDDISNESVINDANTGNEEEVHDNSYEDVVSLGDKVLSKEDSEEEHNGSNLVNTLRKENRAKQKRLKELEKQLEIRTTAITAESADVSLGSKPKLHEFDYDEDSYAVALDAWYDKKSKIEAKLSTMEAQKQAQKQAQEQEIQQKLSDYEAKKANLRIKDFDEAEATVIEHLSNAQQAIILDGADNAALLVYALGKNEQKLKDLSKINNLTKFIFEVSKMESQLKVTKKRIPEPEKVISGGTSTTSNSKDSTLEKLRAEAAKTGDFTKVAAFIRKNR